MLDLRVVQVGPVYCVPEQSHWLGETQLPPFSQGGTQAAEEKHYFRFDKFFFLFMSYELSNHILRILFHYNYKYLHHHNNLHFDKSHWYTQLLINELNEKE